VQSVVLYQNKCVVLYIYFIIVVGIAMYPIHDYMLLLFNTQTHVHEYFKIYFHLRVLYGMHYFISIRMTILFIIFLIMHFVLFCDVIVEKVKVKKTYPTGGADIPTV